MQENQVSRDDGKDDDHTDYNDDANDGTIPLYDREFISDGNQNPLQSINHILILISINPVGDDCELGFHCSTQTWSTSSQAIKIIQVGTNDRLALVRCIFETSFIHTICFFVFPKL